MDASPLKVVFDELNKFVTLNLTCMTCDRPPREGEKEFPLCSACKWVRYCSKECQRRHWKEHKPKCKMTQASHKELKAEEERCLLYSPLALKSWYENRLKAVEYTAFHALQVHKGAQSKFPHDKFAAGFILRHDQKAPGDDSKSEIKIYKFAPVPRAMIDPVVIPDVYWTEAANLNKMIIWITDVERFRSGYVYLCPMPPKDSLKADRDWKQRAMLALA